MSTDDITPDPKAGIKEKIMKLLALGEENRGGTEAERALAIDKAHELLHKHELSQYDLVRKDMGFGITEHHIGPYRMGEYWKGDLATSIAEAFGLEHWFSPLYMGEGTKFERLYAIIGPEDRVDVALHIWEWLMPQLERERVIARQYHMKICKADGREPENGMHYNRSFYIAAGDRVRRRITAREYQLRQQSSGKGTEIEIHWKAKLAGYMAETHPDLTPMADAAISGSGMVAGVQAGSRVDLSPDNRLSE